MRATFGIGALAASNGALMPFPVVVLAEAVAGRLLIPILIRLCGRRNQGGLPAFKSGTGTIRKA